MSSLLVPEFFLYFLFSSIAIFIVIFIPGYVVLKSLQLGQKFLFNTVQSLVIGTAMWVAQGFLLGFLGLRVVTYLYIFVFILFFLRVKKFKRPIINFGKNEVFVFLLILVGVFVQSSAAFFMGVRSSHGLSFCCVDISDNLYFASLSQAVSNNIPPFEPGLFGVVVKNYHYLSNVFVGELVRIFNLPVMFVQFQVSNIYLPVMLGLTTLVFGRAVTKKWSFSYWLLFFIYFGGDFVWFILLFRDNPNIFSMSSLEDGAKFLSNPPRAYAVIQLMGGLSLLKVMLGTKKNIASVLTASLVFGTLIGFKVYVGIFALVGLGALALMGIFKRKRYYGVLFICTFIIALMVYLPVNKNAGGLYFTSFWFFENFIVQPGLHLERLELARRIFFDDHKVLKSLAFDSLFMLVTIVALFGTKLIGIVQTKGSAKILSQQMHVFFLSGIAVSFVFGFFFQQSSGGSNTFNFIVNIFIFLSVYCAATMTWINSKMRKIGIVLSIAVIILTIPRVVNEFQSNIKKITSWNVTTFPKNEISGLEFLSQQQRGLVLVDHTHFKLDDISPYMSLYSEQPMFLSGLGILDSHGVEAKERKKQYESIINGSVLDATKTIYNTHINYVITIPHGLDKLSPYSESLYMNDNIQIIKINRDKISKNIKQ